MSKIYALLLIVVFGLFANVQAQVATNSGSGLAATYTSLANAITALNAASITSPVVITLTGNETAPVGGYSITQLGGTSTNTITIQGSGSTITSGLQVAGSTTDAIFKIIGGDYISIKTFTMVENASNTVTAVGVTNTMTEWGVALLYNSTTNGAQNNTIQGNTISLNRAYFNSFAIYSNVRHSATVPATAAEATTAGGSNSNNKVYSNTISNVAAPIVFVGSSTAAAMDAGNDIGGSGAGTANTITNWGANTAPTIASFISTSATIQAIFMNHQTGYNISYNSMTSASLATTTAINGIFSTYLTTQPTGTFTNTIGNNTVTFTATSTGAIVAINNAAMSTALATATVNINSNNIISSSVAGAFTGILNANLAGTVTLNSNIIRSNTQTATSGAITGIQNTGAVQTSLQINSNQLGNASGNFITYSAAHSSGLLGITSTGTVAANCTVSISSNDFRGIVHSVNGTATHTYITSTGLTNAGIVATVQNNTWTSLSIATSGTATFITHGNTLSVTSQFLINNNSIVTGFTRTVAGSITISTTNSTSNTGSICNYTNNNFSNITVPDNALSTILGFNNTDGGTGSTHVVTGNTFNNIHGGTSGTTGTTGTINCMNFTYWSGVSTFNNNTVTNITGRSTVTGVTIGSTANNATSFSIYNNTINNLVSIGTGGNVTGMSCANSSSNISIYGNTINTLSSTGAASSVIGLTVSGSNATTPTQVYKNKIYDLSGSSTGSIVTGMNISGGTFHNIYNNLIGDLRATAATGTNAINGINITASATDSVFHNSIYLNATSTSVTTFGSSCITFSSTTTLLNVRNNLLYNNSTPAQNGSNLAANGVSACLRRSTGTAATVPANYFSASNNNAFWCNPTAGTNNHLTYIEGTGTYTNPQNTVANWKAFYTTRDQASVQENPTFQSTTGSNANFLKYNLAVASQLESGGAFITAFVTDDYFGTIRNTSTPDIGAWELAGTAADLTAPSVTFTALANSCSAGNRTFTATITDASGVPTSGTGLPVIYWKINAGSYTSTQASYVSGSSYSFSLGTGSVAGDVVSFYIAAQDNAGNVGATPSTGATGASTFPPAFSTAPTTPSTYSVLTTISGTKTIGATGYDYATLTAALVDYNSKCVSGSVIFELQSNYNSASESFPIIINENPGSSALNTLTIRPASGVTATISGTSAGNALVRLNGADRVTIDGSNNGTTTRNLTITNLGTTASTAGVSLMSLGVSAGATNNVIKNCNINTGSSAVNTFGISISGATPGTNGADNDNNIVQNNSITGVNVGVYAFGTANLSAGGNDNVAINSNTITVNATAASSYGIQAGNTINGNINQNTIDVNTTSGTQPVGISLETGYNTSLVSRNKIVRVNTTSTGGFGGRGISVGTAMASSNLTIANNVIYGVNGSNFSGFGNSSSMGIALGMIGSSGTLTTVAGGINIFHNSINMYGTHSYTSATNTASLYVGSAVTALDVRNNIFVNSLTNSTIGGNKDYGIYSAAASTAFTTLDYNDYFGAPTTGNSTFITGFLVSDQSSLANWQTATGKEANGKNVIPSFQSDIDLRPGIGSGILGAGDATTGTTIDFLGVARSNPPSMGAYEMGADVAPPVITYTNLGGTCSTSDVTLTATLTDGSGVDLTPPLKPRMYFRKNAGTWYSVQGIKTLGSANNGTWTFTTDYSQFGGVAVNDVIQYYVVAQDDLGNISANPSAGFAATDVNTITTAPTTPNSYGIQNSLAPGTYSVGAGTIFAEAGHFPTLTAAVASYNISCLSGNVVFALTDATYGVSETFPITIVHNVFASGANQLIIKPNAGVTSTISGSSATALIKLNGADWVTINGSNNLTSTRNLTLTNSSTATSGNGVIWLASVSASDSASNNTISNCIISGDASNTTQMGIFEGPTAAIASTQTNTVSMNVNNIYQNNQIIKVQNGIWAIGRSTTFLTTGTQIKDNLIGTSNSGEGPGVMGIYTSLRDGAVIDNNTMQNLQAASGQSVSLGGTTISGGIYLHESKNSSITKNDVHNFNVGGTGIVRLWLITTQSASFNVVGTPSNNLVANNMVYDSRYTGTGSSTWQMSGINCNGGYGDRFYYNSVSFTGTLGSTTSGPNATFSNGNAINTTASPMIDVRNNIFYLNGSNGVGQFYNFYTSSTDATIATWTVNNNIYFRNVTGGATSFMARTGTTTGGEAFSTWQSTTTKDANSFTTDPQFLSATNLHINPAIATQVESGATPIAAVSVDFDGSARNVTTPDMGADEGTFIALTCFPASNVVGTATSATAANMTWNAGVPAPSNGYQWEVRTSGNGGTGATGLSATGSVGAAILTANTAANALAANTVYTAWVRSFCGGSDYSTWTSSATFSTPCLTYTLPLIEGFNTVGSLPTCWSKEIVTGSVNATDYLITVATATSQTANPSEGAGFVRYNSFSASSGHMQRLRAPAVSTTGLTGGVINLDFWQTSSATYTGNNENMVVEYSLDGTTWVPITTYARNDAAAADLGAWYAKSVAIPAGALGQANVYFGFAFSSFFGYNTYMDNLKILPACQTPSAQPTTLTFPSQGPTNITGAFTVASGVDSFLIVRYPAGSAESVPGNGNTYLTGQSLGLGTIVKVSATGSFNASGLIPATSYDFYIYSMNGNCSGGPLYRTTGPLIGTQSTAACSGTVNTSLSIGPGGDYDNMTEAFAFIVNCGISGPTLLQLQSNYNEATETFPIVVNAIPGSSAINTLTIRPSAGKAPFTWSGSSTSPLIDLSGAKNIILDGRPGGTGSTRGITLLNTGTGPALRYLNNAQNNIIEFVTFTASNASAASGVVVFSTTTGTTLADGNNNNTISNCGINGNGVSNYGIYAAGSAAPADNKSNTISTNDVYNYFSDASSTFRNAGIFVADNNAVSAASAWTITGNSFYQTTSRTFSTMTNGVHAIAISPTTLANSGVFNITNNKIGGTATNLGGSALSYTGTTFQFNPIRISSAGIQGTTVVSGNTISNTMVTSTQTSTAGLAAGIFAGCGNINIDNNTIGSSSTPGALTYGGGSATFFGVHTSGTTQTGNTAINVTNNTIAGITLNGTSATGFMGIGISGSATFTGPNNITGNTIGTTAAGITSSINSAVVSLIFGISQLNAGTYVITGNTLNNFSTLATSTTTTNQIRGINVTGGTNTIGAIGAGKNTIRNFSVVTPQTGTGSNASIVGINITSALTGQAIVNNDIYALRNTGTGANSTSVTGIVAGGLAANLSGSVRLNKIYDLTNTTTGTAGLIIGLNAISTTGTWTIANNMISLSNASNTNNMQLAGTFDAAAGGTRNYYFNSIYVGGSYTGSLPSIALQRNYSATATTIDVSNNLLVNVRTGGTGGHYAIANFLSSGSTPNTGWTSADNVLNAPVSSKIALWGPLGGTGDKTFAQYKNISGAIGGYSGINVIFVNSATGDLHLNFGAAATAIESGGNIGTTGINTDYDGQARPGPTGSVNNGATAADIGADEIDGTPLSVNVGATGVAVPSGSCFSNSQTINISIKNYAATAAINFVLNPVTVSGTIVSPSAVSTPFSVTVNTGNLLAGATLSVQVFTGYDMSAVGNFTIDASATTGADEDNSNDAMSTVTKVGAAVTAGTIVSSNRSYCVTSGKPTITVTGNAGGDIQWQQATDRLFTTPQNVGTFNSLTYTPVSNITQSMYYRARVSCGATIVFSNTDSAIYNNPLLLSYTTSKTRCGAGTVTLTATTNTGSTINWYNSINGAPVASGTSFTTGNLGTDSTFYVSSSVGGTTFNTSKLTYEAASSATNLTTYGQDFTVTTGFTINSVQVFSTTGSAITVSLYSSGGTTQLQTTGSVAVTPGSSPFINLGWYIAPGTYRLCTNGMTGNFYRDNTNTTYPFALSTIGTMNGFVSSITGSVTTSSSYYFMYNWSVSTGCETNRVAIPVTLTVAPPLAVDLPNISICSGVGGTVKITPATLSNYTFFQWSGTSGDRTPGGSPNGSSVLFNGTNATNTATTQLFTVTASGGGAGGLCGQQAIVAVTINPKPTNPTTTGVSICQNGASATLGASSTPATTLIGGSVPITFSSASGVNETTSFATGKVIGSFTLPALPAGATYFSARILANGVFGGTDPTNGQTFGSEIRLGIKTTGGANVTSDGYQGTTVSTSPNPFDYATLRTNADSTTIGSALPSVGGTFNVVYYETFDDITTDNDATFPSGGTLTYLYSYPTTYSWYTGNYTGTLLGTGAAFDPVGVAGSGLSNTSVAGNYTYYVQASNGVCTSTLPRASAVFSIGIRPTPTFTTVPGTTVCGGVGSTPVTYTTQAGKSNYSWIVPGVNNTDYQVTGGAISTLSNTVTLRWLTSGSKTVTVNYSIGSCAGLAPASYTTTVGSYGAPSVTIAGNATTCYGGAVTYTATPVNGPVSYQWKKDGSNVGTNSATYVDAGILGGAITCVVTSTVACASGAQATSNSISLSVTPNTWVGTANTNFSNPANWCAGVVPTSAANVSIPSGTPFMPLLTSDISVNNLDLASGASLEIGYGRTLTVNGSLSGTGTLTGTLLLGTWNSTLVLAKSTGSIGTLYMSPAGSSLKVLRMTGAGSVTLGNALNIYDSVDVKAGTLNSGGFLTLKSVQSGTGRVGQITSGSITGNVTVERWLRNVSRRTFRVLSIPTQGGQTIKQAWMENQPALINGNPGYGTLLTSTFGVAHGYDATTTDNSLLVWNPGTSMFDYAGPTSSPIATTSGYYVYLRGDRSVLPGGSATTTTTLRTNGTLYIGTPTVNAGAGVNTVIGNLYASAIDFLKLQKTAGITSFKLWDAALGGSGTVVGAGTYQTFSAANGWVPVPGGGSYGTAANTRIESGQAFVVSPAGAESVTFTEYAKTTGSRQLLRENNVIQRFKANLYTVNSGNSSLTDGSLVVFDNTYSHGMDNYDVIKMNNFGENLGIANSGKVFTLDARPEVTGFNDEIQYSLSNMIAQQQYSIEFVSENLNPTLTAYLVDNYLHTQTPLALNATQTISFTVNATAASYAINRFKVVFKPTGTLPVTFTTIRANEQNGHVAVDWSVASEKDIRNYVVEHATDGRTYTVVGTVAATANGAIKAEYAMIHENPTAGSNYYRIRSEGLNGDQKYSSVVKVEIGGTKSGYVVTPNPVTDGNINVQFINQPSGRYSIRLINGVGQVIYNQSVQHAGGNSSNRIKLTSTLSGGMYKLQILQPDKTSYVQNLVVSNGK